MVMCTMRHAFEGGAKEPFIVNRSFKSVGVQDPWDVGLRGHSF